jgi:hypothetical protein
MINCATCCTTSPLVLQLLMTKRGWFHYLNFGGFASGLHWLNDLSLIVPTSGTITQYCQVCDHLQPILGGFFNQLQYAIAVENRVDWSYFCHNSNDFEIVWHGDWLEASYRPLRCLYNTPSWLQKLIHSIVRLNLTYLLNQVSVYRG